MQPFCAGGEKFFASFFLHGISVSVTESVKKLSHTESIIKSGRQRAAQSKTKHGRSNTVMQDDIRKNDNEKENETPINSAAGSERTDETLEKIGRAHV